MNTSHTDDQDQQDMARLVAGDDHGLNDLMASHGERLFHYLIRQLGNESEAADLAEDTFVRVYQNAGKFNPRQRFSTWLFVIATNLARDRLRWRQRHPNVSIEAAEVPNGLALRDKLAAANPDPRETLQNDERIIAIRQAVAELPEDLRTPLLLAEYEELAQAEIADILHCTIKAVETRIYRARKQLREKLNPWTQPP